MDPQAMVTGWNSTTEVAVDLVARLGHGLADLELYGQQCDTELLLDDLV